MKIKKEDALALIVDIQERLLPVMEQKDLLLKNTRILMEGLQILDVPMMITQQYTKGLGMTDPSLFPFTGTDHYLEKRTFSCWADEGIQQAIQSCHCRQIILCGIESHICVQQTALDLIHAGYEVILVTDCVSSRKASDKEIALRRMEQEGVRLTTYESLLFEIMETSLHPRFKEISKLIR